jgi:pimeloyl-ACP methyl ester carboxylesterase
VISGIPTRLRRPARARVACLLFSAAFFALPHVAFAVAPSRSQVLLTICPSRTSLRASLRFYADSIQASQAAYAGEALTYAGQSYDRASLRDSAIACYRRAVDARGGDDERLALVDDLLIRRGPGDLETATQILESALDPSSGVTMERDAHQARLAWAKLLADSAQRSYELFRPLEAELDLDPVWGYRMARAFVEVGDVKRALAALRPLAIVSREQDEEIMSLAGRAFKPFGAANKLETEIGRDIEDRDKSEATMLQAMHGRRRRFSAADGFALGGVITAADDKLRRAAVVLVAPGDTIESYDSLTVALGRAGWAVVLMDVRGSGWSAAPACPFRESWVGREDAMQSVCARDVRDALRALSLMAKVDTTRYLVAGVGSTAPIAVEAARLDARVPALLLLSPAPDPVERGTLRESIRRLHRPIYFSSAPEDFLQFETTDVLYQAGDRPNSRVADVSAPGTGARPFRRNAAAVKRLVAWLNETMPARGAAKPKAN